MNDEQQWIRPDTSKNGRLKRTELEVKEEVKARGRSVLSRLGKKDKENTAGQARQKAGQ